MHAERHLPLRGPREEDAVGWQCVVLGHVQQMQRANPREWNREQPYKVGRVESETGR